MSFHADFNAQFYTTHPTFFVFLEVLVKLQATTYVKMRETNVVSPYEKTEREINELILRQYEKCTSGEITRSNYCSKSYFHLPVGELGATYSNILCCNITTCIWRTERVITWS